MEVLLALVAKPNRIRGIEFVDLTTIRYAMGHVYNRGTWYIIDRSGEAV